VKILFVTQNLPYLPCYDGFRLIPANMLKYLGMRHEVYLISFLESKEELKHIPQIKKHCVAVETVEKSPRQRGIRAFLTGFSLSSREEKQYSSREMQSKILGMLKKVDIDIIHVEGMYVAKNVAGIQGIAKVIAPHDAYSHQLYQRFKKSNNIITKLRYGVYWFKFSNFETTVYKKFDWCVLVAPKDRDILQSRLPELNFSVIANGVDCEYFKPEDSRKSDSRDIIFTGNMSFYPNVEAALYFYRTIFPLIRKKLPETRLFIVGADPAQEVKELQKDKNVVVTGSVEDIRPYVFNCSVYVCPLQIGSGIKNKILEAMAMEIPIVATSLSVEGIDASANENIIIADEPEKFAERTIKLLNNKGLRTGIAKKARKLVETEYSWESASSKLEKIYTTLLKKKDEC